MLTPLKNLLFNLVIEAISQKKALPFNKDENGNDILLANLIKATNLACSETNMKGINRPRPNEAGNDIEPYLKKALKEVGYTATTPKTTSGKQKPTGYLDIEFTDKKGRINYIECYCCPNKPGHL